MSCRPTWPPRSHLAHHGSQRGQAALMVTLAMPLTLGIVGLVVDEGWMSAAEAAALAGATQVYKAYTGRSNHCRQEGRKA